MLRCCLLNGSARTTWSVLMMIFGYSYPSHFDSVEEFCEAPYQPDFDRATKERFDLMFFKRLSLLESQRRHVPASLLASLYVVEDAVRYNRDTSLETLWTDDQRLLADVGIVSAWKAIGDLCELDAFPGTVIEVHEQLMRRVFNWEGITGDEVGDLSALEVLDIQIVKAYGQRFRFNPESRMMILQAGWESMDMIMRDDALALALAKKC